MSSLDCLIFPCRSLIVLTYIEDIASENKVRWRSAELMDKKWDQIRLLKEHNEVETTSCGFCAQEKNGIANRTGEEYCLNCLYQIPFSKVWTRFWNKKLIYYIFFSWTFVHWNDHNFQIIAAKHLCKYSILQFCKYLILPFCNFAILQLTLQSWN